MLNAENKIKNAFSYIKNCPKEAARSGFVSNIYHRENFQWENKPVDSECFMVLRDLLLFTNGLDLNIRKSLYDQHKLAFNKIDDLIKWYSQDVNVQSFIMRTWELIDTLDKHLKPLYNNAAHNEQRKKLLSLIQKVKRNTRRLARKNELVQLEASLPNLVKLSQAMRKALSLPDTTFESIIDDEKYDASAPEELRRYKIALKSLFKTHKVLFAAIKSTSGVPESKSSYSSLYDKYQDYDPKDPEEQQTYEELKVVWPLYTKYRSYRPTNPTEDEEKDYINLTNYLRTKPLNKLVLESTYDHLFKQSQDSAATKNPEWDRQYAYIENADAPTKENAEKRRKVKTNLNWFSRISSIAIAIGEGFVAGFFGYQAITHISWLEWLMSMGPLAAIISIVIGVCGAICNYFLFRQDNFTCLKDLWFFKERFYVNKKGKEVDAFTKITMWPAVILAIAAGVSFGFISFTSQQAALVMMLTAMGFSVSTGGVGILIIAGIVALISAKALATVFYVHFVGFIREQGYREIYKNFCNRIILAFTHMINAFIQKQYYNAIITCLRILAAVVYYGIGIGVAVTVSALIIGLGFDKIKQFFITNSGFNENAITSIAKVISGLAAAVNAFFYSNTAFKVIILPFIQFKFFYEPPNEEQHKKVDLQEQVDSSMQTPIDDDLTSTDTFVAETLSMNKVASSLLIGTVVFNGCGIGASISDSPTATNQVDSIWNWLFSNSTASQALGAAALTISSNGGNGAAVHKAMALPAQHSRLFQSSRLEKNTAVIRTNSTHLSEVKSSHDFAVADVVPFLN